MNFFKDKKVLVTGGAGFIGSNLIKRLVCLGADVKSTLHFKQPHGRIDDVNYVCCELTREWDCEKICKDIDYVFLCAANTSGAGVMDKTPFVHLTPNVVMNSYMLEAARKAGVKKLLFVSSTTVYPLKDYPVNENDVNPEDFFPKYKIVASMKHFTERLCDLYSEFTPMKTVVVRAGNTYGPGDDFEWETSHVIPALIRRVIERHDPVEVWGDGSDVKDFIYIDDLVEGILMSMKEVEGSINIASGLCNSVINILFKILKIEGYDARIQFNGSKPTMIPKRMVDVSYAKSFGFCPQVSMDEGLERTIKWYKERV